MPQAHYFLPQEYWQQLTSSLEQMTMTQDSRWEQLTSSLDQMRAAAQDSQSVSLHQLAAEQETQCHELFQLKHEFGQLKGPYGPQPEERDPHRGD
ncbi:hypothetical protein AHAS_Ahas17G0155900 [Arachis hypogaea]